MGCGGTKSEIRGEGEELKLHPEIILRKDMIFNETDFIRKTKIICTLGPSTYSIESIVKLLDEGMCVARLNFSHGDHDWHRGAVNNVREALKQRPKLHCAIMLDTKGPEIRTGLLENKKIDLVKGQELEITTDYSIKGNNTIISCSYKDLPESISVGGKILIADGSLTCVVLEKTNPNSIKVKVMNNVTLGEKKNMNLPGVIVNLPTVTDKDIDDLQNFGVKEKVDAVAASFVRKAEDVRNIRTILGKEGAYIKIISKIENHEGIVNYEEILKASDGIMVARGDMGMEIPMCKVFIAQKYMIDLANVAGKPIITATQMLESMISNPRPTRAETTDIANAVLDGTDCVMLSGETAGGQYPMEAVQIMTEICREAEGSVNYKMIFEKISEYSKPMSKSELACCELVRRAHDSHASIIVIASRSGRLPRILCKFRPPQPIIVLTNNKHVANQLNFSRGIFAFETTSKDKVIGDEVVVEAIQFAIDIGVLKKGGKVAYFICKDPDVNEFEHDLKVIQA